MKIKILFTLLIAICCVLYSCQKKYLEVKPSKALLIPETLSDFQNLLDNINVFNIAPSLQVISSDDFYAKDVAVNAVSDPSEKNSYLWLADIETGVALADWSTPYQQVFYANVILDGLNQLTPDAVTQINWNTIQGSALFHRAFAFYNLAQLFAVNYDAKTASQFLGIPIRLSSDVNQKSTRSTLQQTYLQILKDLTEAESLLPIQSSFTSRPNKRAAQALLARIYLNMADYDKAASYANLCLQANNNLINYNSLISTASSPFPASPGTTNNMEIVFYSRLTSYSFGTSTRTTVDTLLYQSYAANDLRKVIFFGGTPSPKYFKGRYTGSTLRLFGGLANDELYLIRAECYARSGNTDAAMADLNTLLVDRWKTGTFIPLTASNADDALQKVVDERRKELVFRGLRWGDLRRLNNNPKFTKTLTRTYSGTVYSLLPGSLRYVFPIPKQEVLNSGIEQNMR